MVGDLAAVALAVIVICIVILAVTSVYNKRVEAARPHPWPWEDQIHTLKDGKHLQVMLVHPGTSDPPILVGAPIDCDAIDFGEQMADRMARAEDKLLVLNRELPTIR